MLLRRHLLRFAPVLGGLAVTRQPANARPSTGKLPPSIEALSSMRSQVRPISAEEREQRVAKAQQLMRENKLSAIVLTGGRSLFYFTGIRWGNSERLFAFVLPASAKPFCVCPFFEEGRVREQLANGPFKSSSVEVLTWLEDADPYALVCKGLSDRKITAGAIGMEETVPFVFSSGIAKAGPSLTVQSATPVTAGCRAIKSKAELALMQIANNATLAVYRAVYHALEPGMTQDDAEALIAAAYERVGFRGEASVQVGKFSALPHGSATPQTIREGTIVMIDDGCQVEGYGSDITRTFVLGKASDKMKRVFDIVKAAQAAALAEARPGVPCEAVDAAARQVLTKAGFGPDYKFLTHRLGHGIGLDGHEWPYLVRGNRLPLAANMTFSDEPGVYIPGEFGIRLEDDMYITPDGAKLFTGPSPSLEQPFN
jgi:Xaa-Pro dipeptidase